MNTTITVQDLDKVYKLFRSKKDRLLTVLSPLTLHRHRDFYALRDVNFEVKRGETVGIIGLNGSGKSTLLKILTGVLTKSRGCINIAGRVSSLLELGAGFNPELTGMENIYFNGLIMGYSREEMDKIVPEIVEFADIGDYIDQPVRTYSSGMFVRLAFSVAINVEPDILIIDEALAVGDISFQMKCFNRFRKFQEQNKTILFVTHSMDQVLQYCSRAIVLHKGAVAFDGSAKEGVDTYKKIMVDCYNERPHNSDSSDFVSRDYGNKDMIRYGDAKAEIIDFGIYDSSDNKTQQIAGSEEFAIRCRVRFNTKIYDPIFAYTIKDVNGNELVGTNTMIEGSSIPEIDENDVAAVEFRQRMNLKSGGYALSLGCVSLENGGLVVHDRMYDAILFEVVNPKNVVGLFDFGSLIKVEKQC